MKLTYLGHSSFLAETGTARIVTDPFSGIGYPFPSVEADVVTVSHGHFDHCAVEAVGGEPLVLQQPGTSSVRGVTFTAFSSYHDDVQGRKRGKDLIFRMAADGIVLCHLGDIGVPISEELKRALGHIDVLLLPVGGNYTIDGRAAAEYVRVLRPTVAIPMHYKTKRLKIDIAGPEEFLAQFPQEDRRAAGCELTVDRAFLEENQGKIYIMERINSWT